MSSRTYTAIVLAGDRGAGDPVARATGSVCKSLSPVAGKPMLWRVIDTLKAVPAIDRILLVGPRRSIVDVQPGLTGQLEAAGVTWLPPAEGPSKSAASALAQLADTQPVLLTTADHAALTPAMVQAMLDGSGAADLAVGLTAYAPLQAAYPKSQRTVLRFGPGEGFCGCNLFVINTARGRQLVQQWEAVEAQRKRPVRMLTGLLGWRTILRYALRRLTLEQALTTLSRRSGVQVAAVQLPQAEAAIDVDSPEDLAQVEAIIKARASQSA